MAHLHQPNLDEIEVISDEHFEEERLNKAGRENGLMRWFLKSGIFIISGVVIIAGLTIITLSYLQNTTNSSSQASEIISPSSNY